jgi:lipopolysaccharide transport system permease protein
MIYSNVGPMSERVQDPEGVPRDLQAHLSRESPKGTVRVEPPQGFSYLGFRELWKFRELLVFLTWRDIRVRYKQTVIGVAWAVLQPLLMMVVFSVFLGRLANLPSGNTPYPLFVFCGLVPWTMFASAITNAGNSVVGSEKLVTKIYFPRLIIPLASVGSSSGLLILLGIWYQATLSVTILLAPICLLLIAFAAIGIGVILAALNVAYRDVRFVLPFFTQLWLFATPSIFMDIDSLPAKHDGSLLSIWLPWILNLNPLVLLIDAFRDSVLGNSVDCIGCLGAASMAAGLMIVGCFYFRWVEHKFADII